MEYGSYGDSIVAVATRANIKKQKRDEIINFRTEREGKKKGASNITKMNRNATLVSYP